MTNSFIPWKEIWLSPRATIRYLLETSISKHAIWTIFISMLVLDLIGNILEVEVYLSSVRLSLIALPIRLAPVYREGLILIPIYTCIYFLIGGLVLWLTSRAISKSTKDYITLREIHILMLWSVIIPLTIFLIPDAIFYHVFPFWIITALFLFVIVCAACLEFAKIRDGFVAVLFIVLTLIFFLSRFSIKMWLLSDKLTIG